MSKHHHNRGKQKRELRLSVRPQRFEIRKSASGETTISGYAAVFNALSEDIGGFRERIQPGAFSKSLNSNPDVLCLYGHDSNQILGRVASGTLTIAEDDKGLKFSCTLPDTSTARDLIALMERGDLSQMSFGFATVSDQWQDVDGQLIRTLIEVMLFEISVVGQPAYTSTSVNLRTLPKAFRSRVKRDDLDDDDDNDCDPESADYDPDDPDCDDSDDDDEDRCECRCKRCIEGRCEECSNVDCEDDNCDDCPIQQREAHYQLILRKLRA